MAPALGFEPRTKWLTATYSTAELCRNMNTVEAMGQPESYRLKPPTYYLKPLTRILLIQAANLLPQAANPMNFFIVVCNLVDLVWFTLL